MRSNNALRTGAKRYATLVILSVITISNNTHTRGCRYFLPTRGYSPFTRTRIVFQVVPYSFLFLLYFFYSTDQVVPKTLCWFYHNASYLTHVHTRTHTTVLYLYVLLFVRLFKTFFYLFSFFFYFRPKTFFFGPLIFTKTTFLQPVFFQYSRHRLKTTSNVLPSPSPASFKRFKNVW